MAKLLSLLLAMLATGCVCKTDGESGLMSWSLRPHLDTKSQWGAVQNGISVSLRNTGSGIALVVHNYGPAVFEVDSFFQDGYNIEIEAFNQNKIALTEKRGPTFVMRETIPVVKLEAGEEYVSDPIDAFSGKYEAPPDARWLVAIWSYNLMGTSLQGPVITGPLDLKSAG